MCYRVPDANHDNLSLVVLMRCSKTNQSFFPLGGGLGPIKGVISPNSFNRRLTKLFRLSLFFKVPPAFPLLDDVRLGRSGVDDASPEGVASTGFANLTVSEWDCNGASTEGGEPGVRGFVGATSGLRAEPSERGTLLPLLRFIRRLMDREIDLKSEGL